MFIPIRRWQVGSIKLSQGAGSHGGPYLSAANPGDEFALLASQRRCLRNRNATSKNGFYQYTAVYDDKHLVELEKENPQGCILSLKK